MQSTLETKLRNVVKDVILLCSPNGQVTTQSATTENSQIKTSQTTPEHPGNVGRAFSQSLGQSPQVYQGQQFRRLPNTKEDLNKTNLSSTRQEGKPPKIFVLVSTELYLVQKIQS